MTWFSDKGVEISKEDLHHIHTEVRNERRFWYDKIVAYVNFYSTIISALLSGFILGLTQVNNLGQFKYALLIIPIISTILSRFARRTIRLIFRQFIENTGVMAKLELIMGMYGPIKSKNIPTNILFPRDETINPIRHYSNLLRFEKMEEFVEDELKQPDRIFKMKQRVFLILEILSIIMLVGALVLMIWGTSGTLPLQNIS